MNHSVVQGAGKGGGDNSFMVTCLLKMTETELGDGGCMSETSASHHELVEVLCSVHFRCYEGS